MAYRLEASGFRSISCVVPLTVLKCIGMYIFHLYLFTRTWTFIYLFIYLFVGLSVSLFIDLSLFLSSVYPFICLSFCLFIYLLFFLFIYSFIYYIYMYAGMFWLPIQQDKLWTAPVCTWRWPQPRSYNCQQTNARPSH